MAIEKIFKTKTGYCHIQQDKIVLTRDGVVGNLSKVVVGNNITKILMIYGGISLLLFYLALNKLKEGQHLLSLILALIGVFITYGIITSLNNSATRIIEREAIKDVKLKKGILGLTRSRFEVLFENRDGKIKKRLIMLPGSLTDGMSETEKAIKIMKEENLLKE